MTKSFTITSLKLLTLHTFCLHFWAETKFPVFSFRRKRRQHERLVQEDDTIKISDTEEFDSEPHTDVTGNGHAVTSNGHVTAQVHYVRPTKRSSKKSKDKRTSYHLTVADDEAIMIDNDTCNGLENT